jgi:Domain of unknown function (DUF4258)
VNVAELAALADVRGYAAAGRYRLSKHAQVRAAERNVRARDVRRALCSAALCKGQGEGTWKVTGPEADGDDLVLVVAIEGEVIVVTLF